MNVDRTISVIILIFIIIGIIGIFYLWLNPHEVDSYSEWYLLGESGKAGDYPANLSVNQKANLTMGVINHENSTSNYQIKIVQNGTILKEENVTLKNNEKLEIPFEYTAGYPGQYKLEFNLYKMPETGNVYRSLFLLVNVK